MHYMIIEVKQSRGTKMQGEKEEAQEKKRSVRKDTGGGDMFNK